ncbi:MAG: response regulator transcription factor [Epsilonproteobacteria bacterium]|nr:response regulator transcription factor [Campylobacterota bacterium]
MKILKKLIILYIENDTVMLDKYSPLLESNCDTLYIARSGEEAYRIYKEVKPHIVIMDLYVSKIDGITFAKKIRETDNKTALIALSRYAGRELLLEIVNLNFSSYLVKPVDETELLNALHKVSQKINKEKITYLSGNCSWNHNSKTLFYKDEPILLTKREQKLFQLLVEKNGIPCSDDEIFFYVWEDDFDKNVTNSSIRTLIKNLRKKIPVGLIENVYGVGYKINS